MSLAAYPPIGFIPISNANAEAARTFYETTLGLIFESDDRFALVFRAGPARIMLRLAKMPSVTPSHSTVFGWEVPDIEPAVDGLAAQGVTFERFGFFPQDERGIWDAPGGARIAWFKDPDGNTLSLSQHPSAH